MQNIRTSTKKGAATLKSSAKKLSISDGETSNYAYEQEANLTSPSLEIPYQHAFDSLDKEKWESAIVDEV